MTRLEIYGIVLLVLGLAIGAAYLKGHHDGKAVVQEKFDTYVAKVEAEGKRAEAEANAKIMASKLETQNVQTTLSATLDANKRLQLDAAKARAGRSYLPAVPAGTISSNSTACFDRTQLDAALSRFGNGVANLVGEGSSAIILRDGWHKWFDAQTQVK